MNSLSEVRGFTCVAEIVDLNNISSAYRNSIGEDQAEFMSLLHTRLEHKLYEPLMPIALSIRITDVPEI